ncbi:MAG: sigma-70 family RNA polymerase sigma factor [Thermodesulfobacteriota bacterium]
MKQMAVSSNIGAFLRDVERHPLLSREEEFSLAVRHAEKGDIEAAHALVASNLRFVVKIARQYTSYGAGLVDLVQEGSIGLMTAVKKFNPHRGYRLISYAVWWIRARIHEHIMRFCGAVRIGGRKERKMFQSGAIRNRAMRDFSLDCGIDGNSDSVSHLQMLADSSPGQEAVFEESESMKMKKNALSKAVSGLDEREREIITARFLAEKPEKLEDLGRKFGVSRERVRQIESKAIARLKRSPAVSMAKKLT